MTVIQQIFSTRSTLEERRAETFLTYFTLVVKLGFGSKAANLMAYLL